MQGFFDKKYYYYNIPPMSDRDEIEELPVTRDERHLIKGLLVDAFQKSDMPAPLIDQVMNALDSDEQRILAEIRKEKAAKQKIAPPAAPKPAPIQTEIILTDEEKEFNRQLIARHLQTSAWPPKPHIIEAPETKRKARRKKSYDDMTEDQKRSKAEEERIRRQNMSPEEKEEFKRKKRSYYHDLPPEKKAEIMEAQRQKRLLARQKRQESQH